MTATPQILAIDPQRRTNAAAVADAAASRPPSDDV